MNSIYNNTLIKIAVAFCAMVLFLMIAGCNPDETQTVAEFNNLVMQDEFDTEGAPNSALVTMVGVIMSYNITAIERKT
jgi:hypothetical protein